MEKVYRFLSHKLKPLLDSKSGFLLIFNFISNTTKKKKDDI